MSQSNELLEKIYKEIQMIKEDLDEIKAILLLEEEEVTKEELKAIKLAKKQIQKGEYKEWSELEKELK